MKLRRLPSDTYINIRFHGKYKERRKFLVSDFASFSLVIPPSPSTSFIHNNHPITLRPSANGPNVNTSNHNNDIINSNV